MSEQLCLFQTDSDTDNASLSKSDSERKQQAIQRFLDSGKKECDAGVNKYSPGKRNTEYYRLSYRIGRKMKHYHIPGGSVSATLAQYRAEILRQMCDRGAALSEILAQLDDFKNGGK